MALLDGRYEEGKLKETPKPWKLVLVLLVPISLVVIGLTGAEDRRWLVVPILLLLAGRLLDRKKRPPRK